MRTLAEIKEAAIQTRNNMLKKPAHYRKELSRDAIIRYCDEVLSIIQLATDMGAKESE
jgi:hypothetical protein